MERVGTAALRGPAGKARHLRAGANKDGEPRSPGRREAAVLRVLFKAMNGQRSQAMRKSAGASDAVSLLLRGLIDYAGLFPPASLPMPQCVANYETYSRSEWGQMLGRLIVPVASLDEFEEAFAALPASASKSEVPGWRLSALLSNDVTADIARIRLFNDRMSNPSSGRKAGIESVEVKIANADEIRQLSAIIPAGFEAYFEFHLSHSSACVAAVSDCRRRAKIRTGGETAGKFPASASVIEFVRLCAAARVPFKATAGLHHPIRSIHRFTYHPESQSGLMHGFLNLFLAAAFMQAGMETQLAVQVLDERSAQAFQFDDDGVGWREYRLSRNQVASTRTDFAVSFGSCSFSEPIEDLQALHIL